VGVEARCWPAPLYLPGPADTGAGQQQPQQQPRLEVEVMDVDLETGAQTQTDAPPLLLPPTAPTLAANAIIPARTMVEAGGANAGELFQATWPVEQARNEVRITGAASALNGVAGPAARYAIINRADNPLAVVFGPLALFLVQAAFNALNRFQGFKPHAQGTSKAGILPPPLLNHPTFTGYWVLLVLEVLQSGSATDIVMTAVVAMLQLLAQVSDPGPHRMRVDR
jgi:hypothetical protein